MTSRIYESIKSRTPEDIHRIKVTEIDKNELWHKLTATSTPKEKLCEDMGISDRKLRAIASAINKDQENHLEHIVLSDTDGGGYWKDALEGNPIQVARLYNSEHNRGTNILVKASLIKLKGESKHGKAKFAQALEQIKNEKASETQSTLFGGM